MTTSSPAEFWFFADEPIFAEYLVFEFWIDSEALDGILSVYFNDRRLWYMFSELMNGEFDLAYVPLFEIMGEDGRFSFVFDAPQAGASAIVRNIQFANLHFSAVAASEPELFLLWLGVILHIFIVRSKRAL